MTKKADHVAALIDAVNKGLKGKAATRLSDGLRSDVREVIPTGIEVVDRYVIGCGGLPVGRMVEIYSEEGGGKSSFLLSCLAQVQRMGGIGVLAETEVAMETSRAQAFGVDTDRLVLLQPGHLDELVAQAEATMKAIPAGAGPVLFGWDSVAATPSKEEIDEGLDRAGGFDKRAKAISRALRVLGALAASRRVAMVFVNQVRANIGVMFGDKYTTPGGHAIKFHAAVRLQILGGKADKDAMGRHAGKFVTILATKNKVHFPYRKGRVRLDYTRGWDDEWTTVNHAKELGLIGPRARGASGLKEARAALAKHGWGGGKNGEVKQLAEEAFKDVHEDEEGGDE